MGNLCGKESSDNFATPGRTLTSAPPTQPKTSSPPKSKIISEPPRTLGGSGAPTTASSDVTEARRKAAEAAEARAKTSKTKGGKLSTQLEAQKKQTRIETLGEASAVERRMRDSDAAAEARIHN